MVSSCFLQSLSMSHLRPCAATRYGRPHVRAAGATMGAEGGRGGEWAARSVDIWCATNNARPASHPAPGGRGGGAHVRETITKRGLNTLLTTDAPSGIITA